MERVASCLQGKLMSVSEAVQVIHSDMTVGMSGFTSVGYPKAIPKALAKSGHAVNLTVCTGASVGDELDGAMARAGIVKRRYSYQSNKDMRAAINNGSILYSDMHISLIPYLINQGVFPAIDVAVIECTAVTEDGIIPTASLGCSEALVSMAQRVILEVNLTVPETLMGMHDVYTVGIPPHSHEIPIAHPLSRIGSAFIPCPLEKIAAIVYTDEPDSSPNFKTATPMSRQIGSHVVDFLKHEIASGRLPADIGPIQSGVGSVGNAVLQGLHTSGFQGLNMYTEVMQDSALILLDEGVFSGISTTAISLGSDMRQYFYENIARFKQQIVIRPQEISNHPAVIRRLGVVALNTPIEVDIYGNVNSSHIMGSQIMNGIGGSGDFARNARLSIFATESVAKDGLISCIVPMVSHVDHTEHDVQVIVTEQGVADLRGKSPCERAEAIIQSCAHPDYRPLLWDYFHRAKRIASGKHTPHDFATSLSWHLKYMNTGSMK